MPCIDTGAVCCEKRLECDRSEDTGNHQANAGERGAVGMPFPWKIFFETRSNSWVSVASQ